MPIRPVTVKVSAASRRNIHKAQIVNIRARRPRQVRKVRSVMKVRRRTR